jgi:hypothetical protein
MNKALKSKQQRAIYLLLLSLQIIGALSLVWKELPDFRQLALNPGEQLPYVPYGNLATLAALFVMQVAYWYRLQRVALPFHSSNAILNHLLLFLGRLSFIFGGALFSVVFFRHLPELDKGTDALVMAERGLLLGGALFALFCFTLELERLGRAFEGDL